MQAELPLEGWHRVGRLADFDSSTHKVVRVLARAVLVTRIAPREFTALEFLCKHQGAPLRLDDLGGGTVTCRRHGWRYRVADGRCLEGRGPDLRRFAAQVVGDEIFVRVG